MWEKHAYLTIVLVVVLCSGLTPGCSSHFDKYERVQKVRSDFSTLWKTRADRYRVEIAAKSPAEGALEIARGAGKGNSEADDLTLSDYLYQIEFRRGSLAVLEDFEKFRKSEPVLSVALSWLRARAQTHWSRLQKEGVKEERLREMIAAAARGDKQPTGAMETSYMWQNVGGITEVATIHLDLVRFRNEYSRSFQRDKREVRETSGTSAQDMGAAISGVLIGVGAAFPR